MRRYLLLFLLALAVAGCSGEPPVTLPTASFEDGQFNNNGETHFISLRLKQDGKNLSGRYSWNWFSVMQRPVFGDLTGTIEGNKLELKLKLPEKEAKKRKMEEMVMLLTYEPATPADANYVKKIVSNRRSAYEEEGRGDVLPKDLDTRKIMKLQGSLNYRLAGKEDRMAIGFIPDISVGDFEEDEGK